MDDAITRELASRSRSKSTEYAILAMAFAIWLLPPAVTAFFVWTHGVDAIYWDQWSLAPLHVKFADNMLTLGDIWSQHNETRIPITKTITVLLAWMFGWNTRIEMAITLAVIFGTAINVLVLARRTFPEFHAAKLFLLCALSNSVIFSPIQHENLLWGFQTCLVLPMFFVSGALVAATCGSSQRVKFLSTFVLCVMALLSTANGVFAFFVVAPVLFFHTWKPRGRYIATWLLGAGAVSVMYFAGLSKVENHPSWSTALQYPKAALKYLILYFGSPLGTGLEPLGVPARLLFGASVLGIVCIVFGLLASVLRSREAIGKALPWVAVAAFALFTAGITMVARLGFGPDQACSSRYASNANFLVVSLIFCVPVCFGELRRRASDIWLIATCRIEGALVVLVLLASFFSYTAGKQVMAQSQAQRMAGRCMVQFAGHFLTPEIRAFCYPDPEYVRQQAKALANIDYLNWPLVSQRFEDSARDLSLDSEYGYFDEMRILDDGSAHVSGWAMIPGQGRPADIVVVVTESSDGSLSPFALVRVHVPREDVRAHFGYRQLSPVGWTGTINPPQAGARVSAWAFDSETATAYKLRNSHSVPSNSR